MQWAVMLSPWELEVRRIEKDEDGLAGLLAASISPREHLDKAVEDLVPRKGMGKPETPLYCLEQLEDDYKGCVVSFDGSAKRNRPTGSAGYILWQLPGWVPMFAQGDHLEDVTVNESEYQAMLRGMKAAQARGIKDIVVIGDSAIAIQQAQGLVACHKPHLQVLLDEYHKLAATFDRVRLIHVNRPFNAAADYLTQRVTDATTAGESDQEEKDFLVRLNKLPERLRVGPPPPATVNMALGECWLTRAQDYARRQRLRQGLPEPVDPTVERWRRIAANQDADPKLMWLKLFLRGELTRLTAEQAQACAKIADAYVLRDDGVLCFEGYNFRRRGAQKELTLRPVVPSNMQHDVLHQCHDDVQGGHQGITRTYDRVRQEYFWVGMYADVVRYVTDCVDCATSQGIPPDPGESPGNIMAEYPFHIVSMDFVLPLPKSARGNVALLLFQCVFTGLVLCKPMASTTALEVAKAYEEVVFRRFGASSIIRSDRDPRFMGEVFKCFREMMGSQQRATLAYRPQANGQQERSVQAVIRTIKRYVEDPAQQDWDDFAEKLMWAINTSFDNTRKDTPFFLAHGWDSKNTMSAMLSATPMARTVRDPYLWRIKQQRDYEYAMSSARLLQEEAKRQRAATHNARRALALGPEPQEWRVGDAVWLYLAKVKPGLSKKLAHLWHGPFRIVDKDENFRVKLKVDGIAYRFFPWIHVSRLKHRILSPERPTNRPGPDGTDEASPELAEEDDFDCTLLPEDSWEPEPSAGEYEVKALHDVRWSRPVRSGRRVKEYLVEWVGYEERDWIPAARLNCGRLMHDFDRGTKAKQRFQAMQVTNDEGEPAL